MLQKALEAQRRSGGLVPRVAAELDNMVRFAREAALPALEIASAPSESALGASESTPVASGSAPGASDSVQRASASRPGTSESVSGEPQSAPGESGGALGASVNVSERAPDSTPEGTGRASVKDLRLLVFGGGAESLLSSYLENACKQRAARVVDSDSRDEESDADGRAALEQEEATSRDVLAGLLGVAAPVTGQQRVLQFSLYAVWLSHRTLVFWKASGISCLQCSGQCTIESRLGGLPATVGFLFLACHLQPCLIPFRCFVTRTAFIVETGESRRIDSKVSLYAVAILYGFFF